MTGYRKSPRTSPWAPAKATEEIRKLAHQDFEFNWSWHADEQRLARDLIIGDITHVLKNGFVHEEAEPSTRKGFLNTRLSPEAPIPVAELCE